MVHLLPSRSILAGFFRRILSGFGFLPGAGLLPRAGNSRSPTVLPARSDGFLCVISDLSTFRSPLVTSEPLFNSKNTASNPPEDITGVDLVLTSSTGGGPGGGGGGGGGIAVLPLAVDGSDGGI